MSDLNRRQMLGSAALAAGLALQPEEPRRGGQA